MVTFKKPEKARNYEFFKKNKTRRQQNHKNLHNSGPRPSPGLKICMHLAISMSEGSGMVLDHKGINFDEFFDLKISTQNRQKQGAGGEMP